jgi:hypothetical protein
MCEISRRILDSVALGTDVGLFFIMSAENQCLKIGRIEREEAWNKEAFLIEIITKFSDAIGIFRHAL